MMSATVSTIISNWSLHDIYNVLISVPAVYTLIGHSLFVASTTPQYKDYWFIHYWNGFLYAYGGGLLSAMLVMDPKECPISLFSSNLLLLVWTACWWLMCYCPFNLVNRLHDSFLPFRVFTKGSLAFNRAFIIVKRVDLACKLYPGVVAPPILLGTMGASAGRFLMDAFMSGMGDLTSSEAVVQTFSFRSGAYGALLYYFAAKHWGLLGSEEATVLMVLLFVSQAVLSELLRLPMDWTAPLAALFHKITLIPAPKPRQALLAAKAKANATKVQQQQLGDKKANSKVENGIANDKGGRVDAVIKANGQSQPLNGKGKQQEPNGKEQQQTNGSISVQAIAGKSQAQQKVQQSARRENKKSR